MSNWKHARNNLSELTLEQFIQNTIDEEIFIATESGFLGFPATSEQLDRMEEEGYYRAVAILNEVL